jgi:hypothetical protein
MHLGAQLSQKAKLKRVPGTLSGIVCQMPLSLRRMTGDMGSSLSGAKPPTTRHTVKSISNWLHKSVHTGRKAQHQLHIGS